jgi:NAD(P)-dependent dehydrogenase (short-subunit alcohol dehydrogenase family)
VTAARHRKVVVITGGRGRIGGALASALEHRGHTVVAIDRAALPRPPRRRTVRRSLQAPQAPPGEVVHLRADLGSAAQTRRAFRTVLDRYQRIDAAVLAAGAFVSGPFLSHAASDGERMFRDNVMTAFLCLQELARTMPRTGGGHVIFMGSIVDHRVVQGNALYGASKAALRMLAEVVREETRDTPMRITNLCLGAVASPMTRALKRRARLLDTLEPARVVEAVLWLLDRPAEPRFDELRLFPSVGVNEP